jgi:ribosomal protein S18 acetylase RimI-like enzyme
MLRSILDKKNTKPGYFPEKDLFLARQNNKIIAYGNIHSELKIGRIILHTYVIPGYRHTGILSRLFEACIERGREQRADRVHVYVSEHDKTRMKFLSSLQFSRVRSYLDLEIDLQRIPFEQKDLISVKKGYLKKGDEKILADLQNKTFSGSWGFCPNTEEEIIYYLELTGCRLEDIMFILEKGKPAGYLWYHPAKYSEMSNAVSRVRIHMLGIHPDSRGKGFGKRLLSSGLFNIYREGMKTAVLTVDEENQAALSLYESFRFKLIEKAYWYEKKI